MDPVTIRNKRSYFQYLLTISLVLVACLVVLFFVNPHYPMAFFTLFFLLELLVLSIRFTAEVSVTDTNLQITYYKWAIRKVLSYDPSNTTAKSTWTVLLSGSKYKIIKIYFQGKLVYSFNTNEGFDDDDLYTLSEVLKSKEADSEKTRPSV